MNTNGPVLRDIHLPPAAWWPPAPGWWLLAALLVAVAAGFTWWLWRRRRSRWLRLVMLEIDTMAAAFAHDGDIAAVAMGASRLLRRVALRIDPAAVASQGTEWRAFLQSHTHDTRAAMLLEGLADTAFQPRPNIDPGATLAALRSWCRDSLRGYRARRESTLPAAPTGSMKESASP